MRHRILAPWFALVVLTGACAAFGVFHDGLSIGGWWWADVAACVALCAGLVYYALHALLEHE